MFGKKPLLMRIPRYACVLITIFLLVLTGVCMYFYTKYQEKWLMALVVILTLVFVLSMNTMVSRFAVFKAKKIKYPRAYYKIKSFSEIESSLLKAGFAKTNKQFGEGFIKIDGKVAYKVLLVEKSEKYFDNDTKDDSKPTKGIEKCTKLVGFEVFFEDNENVKKRIPDFSFKGDKVLYEGFYFDSAIERIVEANKIDVAPHNEEYDKLMSILAFEPFDYVEEKKKK